MATREKFIPKQYSVDSIYKKLMRNQLSTDYKIQRSKDRWSNVDKGNLISDVAQGNHIPELIFAEFVDHNFSTVYVIDGKQRTTILVDFIEDKFRVSKDVEIGEIEYVDGNEIKKFDIRNKKFSDFPEALKDQLRDYTFNVTQYINCTKEELEYHMSRYNRGVKMNTSEKGIVALGEDFASEVHRIASLPFFSIDYDNYTKSEHKNGSMLRCICESFMRVFFPEKWTDKTGTMCKFIRENATKEQFETLYEMFESLGKTISEKAINLFSCKNTFLFMGLFAKFRRYNLDDSVFTEFLDNFVKDLHTTEIDGVTWDTLMEDRHNKNVSVVNLRMDYLEKLMLMNIDVPEISVDDSDDEDPMSDREFISEVIGKEIDDEDSEFYGDTLSDYTINVDNNSSLMDDENSKSLKAIVAYAYEKDVDPTNWFISFFKRNNTYIKDQRQNFNMMKDDFDDFYKKIEASNTAA